MSNKSKAIAVFALATLMGSSSVFANNSVEFKTTINVKGVEACTLDVSSLNSKHSWALD